MGNFWETALSICGLSAISSFVFWSIYKAWIKQGIFKELTKYQTFKIMLVSLILTFIFSLSSLGVYVFINTDRNEKKKEKTGRVEISEKNRILRSMTEKKLKTLKDAQKILFQEPDQKKVLEELVKGHYQPSFEYLSKPYTIAKKQHDFINDNTSLITDEDINELNKQYQQINIALEIPKKYRFAQVININSSSNELSPDSIEAINAVKDGIPIVFKYSKSFKEIINKEIYKAKRILYTQLELTQKKHDILNEARKVLFLQPDHAKALKDLETKNYQDGLKYLLDFYVIPEKQNNFINENTFLFSKEYIIELNNLYQEIKKAMEIPIKYAVSQIVNKNKTPEASQNVKKVIYTLRDNIPIALNYSKSFKKIINNEINKTKHILFTQSN